METEDYYDKDYWTDEEIAHYLGTLSAASVRAWRRRYGIASANRSSAAEVKEAAQKMPGRGRYERRPRPA